MISKRMKFVSYNAIWFLYFIRQQFYAYYRFGDSLLGETTFNN